MLNFSNAPLTNTHVNKTFLVQINECDNYDNVTQCIASKFIVPKLMVESANDVHVQNVDVEQGSLNFGFVLCYNTGPEIT